MRGIYRRLGLKVCCVYCCLNKRITANVVVLDVLIVDAKSDLNLYKGSSYLPQSQSSCCGTGCGSQEATSDIADLDFNEWVGELAPYPGSMMPLTIYVGSFQIYAVKR
jgi:hypothetical protein